MSDGTVLWLSGRPACGVAGIAHRVAELLHARGVPAEVLDEREMRHGATGYRPASEAESWSGRGRMVLRYIAPILARHGVLPICVAVSPVRSTPEDVRAPGARVIVMAVECRAAEGAQQSSRRLGDGSSRRDGRRVSDGIPPDTPAQIRVQRQPGRSGGEHAATEVIRALEQLGVLACRAASPAPPALAADQADEVRRRLNGLGYA